MDILSSEVPQLKHHKTTTNLQIILPQLLEVGIETHHGPTRCHYNQNLFLRLPDFITINITGGHSNRASSSCNTNLVWQQRYLSQYTRLTESFIDTPTMGLQNLSKTPTIITKLGCYTLLVVFYYPVATKLWSKIIKLKSQYEHIHTSIIKGTWKKKKRVKHYNRIKIVASEST